MKEKELRLALVCYGGVSLAVYMHGVTKEILKLVRASRDRNSSSPGQRADTRDTEDVYAGLLNAFEPDLDLRIVVDIIAGASAGGINGIILGRALAHDLDIDPVRSFWLTHTDVTELMSNKVQAKPWHKVLFRPFIWGLMWAFRKTLSGDREFKKKLSIFLRSRWFRPPFDGSKLTHVLFSGMSAMGDPKPKNPSLLPNGLPLDLFVTVTDFFGFTKETPIHDPPSVIEREHRQVIRFSYKKSTAGKVSSDFDRDNIPALAFASRATSSFPGAFPPAQLKECDQLIQREGVVWKKRVDFLYDNFRPYLTNGLNPADAAFVDGSVLVNKPFAQAIGAIAGRPAYRQVDRRVLYIDPHPRGPRNNSRDAAPGLFRTLKGSLSDIPRNEPIHEDLSWVNSYNAEVRRLQTIIEASRPHIKAIVGSVAGKALDGPVDGATISRFRLAANAKARAETGFAYEGYLRLKLASVIDEVADLISSLCGHNQAGPERDQIKSLIDSWANTSGIGLKLATLNADPVNGDSPKWVRFLLNFDAGYRQRRLRFAIRTVNQLYPRLGKGELQSVTANDLDCLKAGLYGALDLMAPLNQTQNSIPAAIADKIKVLIKGVREKYEGGSKEIFNAVDQVIEALGLSLDFESHAERAESILATLTKDMPPAVRIEVLQAYIGFAAWDVLTFSVTNWRDLDEFDEIRVDRVSPDDAQSLRPGGTAACLKGQHFNHFGAFFSRAYRENDYLWGRLHAAERLIDIVVDAARLEGAGKNLDVQKIKARAFLAILETEGGQLPRCKTLVAELRGAASVL
ncbi:MAG: patatin-like protein [Rhodospirillaceae bacterium]|nr:patatin-like protein [Rhodospirillaceae bacterium]